MNFRVCLHSPEGTHKWAVLRQRLGRNWGLCLHDDKKILLHDCKDYDMLLRTAIHEATHAACPDLSEHAVVRIENSVTAILYPLIQEICDGMEDE